MLCLGRWPYRCRACGKRFWAWHRQPVAPVEKPLPHYQPPAPGDFQAHPSEPVACVVVRADSQAQLDRMLLDLNAALSQYNQQTEGARQAR